MKTILQIFALVLTAGISPVYSQLYLDSINFENPLSSNTAIFLNSNDTVNPWIIGNPQKIIFNETYTEPNAIFTDTVNSVQANDSSSFVVRFRFNSNAAFGMQFKTKLSLITGDTAFVQYSYDGITWHHPTGSEGQTDPCGMATVLQTSYPFTSQNNMDTMAAVEYWNMSCPTLNPFDTIFYRFTLVTGPDTALREGWLIDDIVFYTGLQSNVELSEQKMMKVFPNPVSNVLNIDLPEKLDEDMFVRIFDMQGKAVYAQIIGQVEAFPLTIPIQHLNLQEGTYIVCIQSGNKQFAEQILVRNEL